MSKRKPFRMPYGQYAGQTFATMPRAYVQTLMYDAEDATVRSAARKYIFATQRFEAAQSEADALAREAGATA